MDRNFFRRVEVAFPIEDKLLHARVVKETLEGYLADNTQAWILQTDGSYMRLQPDGAPPLSAQVALLKKLTEQS
jgi:polyphosphate kinase